MIQHYDSNKRATLLQRCHRTFLDCVDYDHLDTQKENVLKAFDFFSQIYCQKFEVGALESEEEDMQDKERMLGVYKMVHDIHDNQYRTPLTALKGLKVPDHPDKKAKDIHEIMWWILIVICGILTFLYFVGLYFTYFDDPGEFERTFSNDLKLKNGVEEMIAQHQRSKEIKESF